MKEAREVGAEEKMNLVTVDELDKKYRCNISVKHKKFICPDCLEYVGYIYCTGRSSYFAHEKSDGTRKCDLYIKSVSNNQNYSPYSRTGLPLYLLKRDKDFYLNVGFYPINGGTLKMAEETKLCFNIFTNENLKIATLKINQETFSEEMTAYFQIDKLSNEYWLQFNNEEIPKEINEKWNNKIEGFNDTGAFFRFFKNGGMKIRRSEKISIGTDYYLLCKKERITIIDEAEIEKIGEITFSESYWSKNVFGVYRVRFYSTTKRNIRFCLELGVLLVDSLPVLIPLWPPCNKHEQLLLYKKKQVARFFYKTLEKNERRIVIHPGKQANLIDVDESRAIVAIPVDDDEKLISIGRENAPFYFNLVAIPINTDSFERKIIVQDEKGNIYKSEEYSKLPFNNKLNISTNFKSLIHVYKNNATKWVYQNKDSILIDNICFSESIIIHHGLDVTLKLEFIRARKEKPSFNENEFAFISTCQNDLIPTPIYLKYILPLFSNYPVIIDFIKKSLIFGFVNKHALYKLNKIAKNLGGNSHD